MKKTIIYILLALTLGCNKDEKPPVSADNQVEIKNEFITTSYIGNGVQWGGYDILEFWTGNAGLSEEDWETLFKRVEFLRPPIVRIMLSPGWNYLVDGVYTPEKSDDILIKILDFCQDHQVKVMIGEWGHKGGDTIDHSWLNQAATFLDFLLNTKQYSCISYYNMVNEPNGSWSSTEGNYELWKSLINDFYTLLEEKGLESAVDIIGPSVAIRDLRSTYWLTNTKTELSGSINAYDIHTYPAQEEVRTGAYMEMVRTYRQEAPQGKPMLMSEVGFKYPANTDLGIENEKREDEDAYASDDSNMFIYDAFYGIDMADAIIQNMLAGMDGVIVWDLDDAMYNYDGSGSTELKRWGFWNILGSEKFENPGDENIRPWFYPVSLLTRFFPAGSNIRDMKIPDKKGLRVIAGEINGKYTIAAVNSNYVSYNLTLGAEESIILNNICKYRYTAGKANNFTGNTDSDGFPVPAETGLILDFTGGKEIPLELPGQTFILYTNLN